MGLEAERCLNFGMVLKLAIQSMLNYDVELIYTCKQLIAVTHDLDTLLSSGCDSEDIKGYDQISHVRSHLVERVSYLQASTIPGLIAKAECSLLKSINRGYDGGVDIGLSVCRDIMLLKKR